jgi:hypothetical protein
MKLKGGHDDMRTPMIPYEGQTCKNCERDAVPADILSQYRATGGDLQIQCHCPHCGTTNDILLTPLCFG